MTILQLLPVILSLIVLAAHFLRAGSIAMIAVVSALMGLLGVRRWWVARTVQVALLLGAAEWVRTLIELATLRVQTGEPVLRLSLILGAVALLTALSALLFQTSRLRSRYGLGEPQISDDG